MISEYQNCKDRKNEASDQNQANLNSARKTIGRRLARSALARGVALTLRLVLGVRPIMQSFLYIEQMQLIVSNYMYICRHVCLKYFGIII